MLSEVGTVGDLASLIAGLADNKLFLGRRYAEWCTAAPTLESAVAAAAMAQEEIGHARGLYPLLRTVVGESAETKPETRSEFQVAEFLHEPFAGWTDFVAANVLFDTALTVVLEAAQCSSESDLGVRARRILEEEPLHWLHGEGWARRLARRQGAVLRALQSSLHRVTPDALGWFDIVTHDLVHQKVVDGGAEELRTRFSTRVNAVLIPVGLEGL